MSFTCISLSENPNYFGQIESNESRCNERIYLLQQSTTVAAVGYN